VPAFPRRSRLLAATTAVAALLVPAASAHATGFGPLVPRGGVSLPRGARDAGRLPVRTEIHAMVALRARDTAALSAYATAVSTPGSPDFHHYLSVAGFRARFAPRPAALHTVMAQLRAEGLSVGEPAANGLSIPITASAGATDHAFSTSIERFTTRGGGIGEVPTSPGHLAGAAGGLVQGVVGLDSVAPSASVHVGSRRARPGAVRRRASSTGAGPQTCAAARTAAAANGSLTADQIAARYGLSNFYAAGDEGRGMTIALYELEPFSAADVATYQACLGTSASVSVETVDGGAGTGPGSGEAATDVEDLVGLAPQATIRVYEGPPTGLGAYDTYSAIISDDAASIVSTSWGLCESEEGLVGADAENLLLQEAAVQGQTILAASGDSGADDCGDGQLSVDDPGSQPWVTAVGGTSARSSGDTVWNDALGAGGGGASEFWSRPSWQTASEPQSQVGCGVAGNSCREVPDISADADPSTGYTAFYRGAWRTVGGTSLAAPTVAALAALADASPACAGRRLGFLDPALYADAADIRDVAVGENSFDGVAGFSALAGYDMASGLGTPTAALGPALCGDALTLATPTARIWSTTHAASLALQATSATGAAISWSATGLPAGLTLNPSSGRVTGTPTTPGRVTVTVTALDADGATASASFTATVSGVATSGLRRRPGGAHAGSTGATAAAIVVHAGVLDGRVGRRLRTRVRARDTRGLTLRFTAVGLPRGVRIASRTGIVSGTPLLAGRATATIRISDASGASTTALLRCTISAAAR
jgi:hypothetical protein